MKILDMKILEIPKVRKMSKIILVITLLCLVFVCWSEAMAQIVSDEYMDVDLESKRLIVAPVVIGSVGEIKTYSKDQNKFVLNSPSWEIGELQKSINSLLPIKVRKHSRISRVYGSDYKELPLFVKRSLPVNDQESISVEIPEDGSKVNMILKGQNQTEPDFILFIGLASFTQGTGISLDMIAEDNIQKLGWNLLNFRYVFWDNNKGKIVAYREGHIYLPQMDASDLRETPMANMDKNADFLARFILSRTPFAKPNLPYVD